MRVGLLVFGIMIASASLASGQDDVRRELDHLKRTVEQQSAEIDRLKQASLDGEIGDYLDASQGLEATSKPTAGL